MFKKKDKLNKLSVEELEQILRIKQREARQERFLRLSSEGASTNMALLGGNDASPPASVATATASNAALMNGPQFFPLKAGRAAASPPENRSLRDKVLLAFEVGAVVGLVAVLLVSYLNLRDLNQEVVEARDLSRNRIALSQALVPQQSLKAADAQPQPFGEAQDNLIFDIGRLPGGHTPPTASGGAAPDIPAHLQNWVQPSPPAAIAIPKQEAAKATRIVIPKLNVDAPIIDGVSWEDLKKGVGHLPNSAHPGQRGNLYLAAHNDIFGEIFRYLDDLEPGDEYHIYAGEAKYTYVVREKRIIDPTEVSVMLPTTEPVATLQTCYPYLIDTHRLVVIGDLIE
ncbi:MAG TPA: class E sortase [Chloroflexi bacterium]|nr:MAG: hypothetical protein B6243_09530 [Anaerolineaceae bacterium 4572_5.2]HEY83769.1 class E sortase [Chloroflexota bacterium]